MSWETSIISSWFTILAAFLVSLLFTVILWKTGVLGVFHKRYEAGVPKALGSFPKEKAVFKLDKILEAEIPKWMAKPPLSYAICFLIVCIGIGVIILVIGIVL